MRLDWPTPSPGDVASWFCPDHPHDLLAVVSPARSRRPFARCPACAGGAVAGAVSFAFVARGPRTLPRGFLARTRRWSAMAKRAWTARKAREAKRAAKRRKGRRLTYKPLTALDRLDGG